MAILPAAGKIGAVNTPFPPVADVEPPLYNALAKRCDGCEAVLSATTKKKYFSATASYNRVLVTNYCDETN